MSILNPIFTFGVPFLGRNAIDLVKLAQFMFCVFRTLMFSVLPVKQELQTRLNKFSHFEDKLPNLVVQQTAMGVTRSEMSHHLICPYFVSVSHEFQFCLFKPWLINAQSPCTATCEH